MSNVEWIKIHTDDKYVDKFSANTVNAKSMVSNNIVGPFGPITTTLLSYSTATDTRIIGTGNFLDDINNISNPDGVILASNFTNGAIFEAYCSGQFTIPGGSSGANPSKVAFRLTFNPLTAPANTSFGQTEVNTSINSLDVQTFEYRCTFRVVSYTNTTINITFVTSGQCARSGASGVSATFQLNQTSADNIQKITKDRTLDGNINLAICIYNISDYNLNISRYTSYIKRIV